MATQETSGIELKGLKIIGAPRHQYRYTIHTEVVYGKGTKNMFFARIENFGCWQQRRLAASLVSVNIFLYGNGQDTATSVEYMHLFGKYLCLYYIFMNGNFKGRVWRWTFLIILSSNICFSSCLLFALVGRYESFLICIFIVTVPNCIIFFFLSENAGCCYNLFFCLLMLTLYSGFRFLYEDIKIGDIYFRNSWNSLHANIGKPKVFGQLLNKDLKHMHFIALNLI